MGSLARHGHDFLALLRESFQPASAASLLSARARERRQLAAFFGVTLRRGRSGCVYVTGAPGTGKTMLVAAALEENRLAFGMGAFPGHVLPQKVAVNDNITTTTESDSSSRSNDADRNAAVAPSVKRSARSASSARNSASQSHSLRSRSSLSSQSYGSEMPAFSLVWLNAMSIADRTVRLEAVLSADARAAAAAAAASAARLAAGGGPAVALNSRNSNYYGGHSKSKVGRPKRRHQSDSEDSDDDDDFHDNDGADSDDDDLYTTTKQAKTKTQAVANSEPENENGNETATTTETAVTETAVTETASNAAVQSGGDNESLTMRARIKAAQQKQQQQTNNSSLAVDSDSDYSDDVNDDDTDNDDNNHALGRTRRRQDRDDDGQHTYAAVTAAGLADAQDRRYALRCRRPMTVLVIDEVDQLLLRSKAALMRVFQAPRRAFSSLVIVAIANKVTLTLDDTLPVLMQAGLAPPTVVFAPYERECLIEICKYRVAAAVTAMAKQLRSDATALGYTESASTKATTKARATRQSAKTKGKMPASRRNSSRSYNNNGDSDSDGSDSDSDDNGETAAAALSRACRHAPALAFSPDGLTLMAMFVAKESGDARLFLAHCTDALTDAGAFAAAAACPHARAVKRVVAAHAALRRVRAAEAHGYTVCARSSALYNDDDGAAAFAVRRRESPQERAAAVATARATLAAAAEARHGVECSCVAGTLYGALLAVYCSAAFGTGHDEAIAKQGGAAKLALVAMAQSTAGSGSAAAAVESTVKPTTAAAGTVLPVVSYRQASQVVTRLKGDKSVVRLVANLPRAQLLLLLVLTMAQRFHVDGVVGEFTTIAVFAKKCAGIMKGLGMPDMTAVAVDETLELLRVRTKQ